MNTKLIRCWEMRKARHSALRNLRVHILSSLAATTGLFSAGSLPASEIVAWGYGGNGETAVPTGLNNASTISAGYYFSLALTAEGRVAGWGANDFGQTNIPGGLSNVVAIAAGGWHSLALTAERKVLAWGRDSDGQTNVPGGLSNIVAIAGGGYHSLALTAEGRVVGWGLNDAGQTNTPSGLSNVIAIAGGFHHSLALTGDGRVVGWGLNDQGQTNIPAGLTNIVAIAAGQWHSMALSAEGRVTAWGENSSGQTNIPSGLSNVVAIAGGGDHSLALTLTGQVVAWGFRASGESNAVAITAGQSHSVALRSDEPPVILEHPTPQWAIAGETVAFRVTSARTAAGSPPLSFQWQKDRTNLPGQTTTNLILIGVTPSNAGEYAAIVRDFAGHSTTSSVARLTVDCLVNVAATFGGSVTRIPNLPTYPGNSAVTLTAAPDMGYGFIRWSGDANTTVNPLVVALDTNKNISAVFASTSLFLSKQGEGTVTKSPDQPHYDVGQTVTLNAVPARWHLFSGWSDAVTNNPRIVTIGESNAYTGIFTSTTPLETVIIGDVTRLAPVGMPAVLVDGTFIVTESVNARGSARISLSSTLPNRTLLYTLDESEPSLAATLYTGPFTVGRTCLLRTIAYNADFTQSVLGDPLSIGILPTLTGLAAGGGSVIIEPAVGAYFSNSLATVTASVAAGWSFLHWIGDATGTNPVLSLSMTRNKNVRAVFGTSLSTAVVGGGSIVVDPTAAAYPFGSRVRLTAVPANGNYLTFWANAASGMTNNPLTFTVTNSNPTVTAVFTSLGGAQTNSLTVIPNGPGQVALTPPGHRFPRNTNVVLNAVPDAGQDFLGWSGAVFGPQNPLVVTMTSNTVLTANFTKRPQLQGEGHRELLSQEGFRLTLTGEWGTPYRLDRSTNLTDWTPLITLTNTFGTVQFTDGAATNLSRRFYRAVAPP